MVYSTVGKEVFSGCSEYQIGCFDTKIGLLFSLFKYLEVLTGVLQWI